MINSIFNPYARGIVKVAPIREDIDTTTLTPNNINIGKYTEVDPSVYGPGTYYYFDEEYQRYNSIYITWDSVPNYDKTKKYYTYDSTESSLLEPLKDIIDICGTNPSEINYSKNTSSSEESGRTQGSFSSGIFLNMHKDILGRVRNIEMTFPPMFLEKYSKLDDLFMNKTQVIKTTETTYVDNDNDGNIDIDEDGNVVTEEKEISAEQYIIWYYVEILLPETGGVVRDIYYVGDSSFTGVSIEYRNTVTETDIHGNPTKIEAKPFAKNLKVNLVGKCAINAMANI